jgi:hypothetical protein
MSICNVECRVGLVFEENVKFSKFTPLLYRLLKSAVVAFRSAMYVLGGAHMMPNKFLLSLFA